MLTLSFLAALAALGLGVFLYQVVLSAPRSTDRANEIAEAIPTRA